MKRIFRTVRDIDRVADLRTNTLSTVRRGLRSPWSAAARLAAVCVGAMLLAGACGGGPRQAQPGDLKSQIDGLPPDQQITYLRSAQAGGNRDPKVEFYLGNAFLNMDRADSAVTHYESALAADSSYAKANVNLGIALEKLNRMDEAKSHYERAIEIDSTDVLAQCHLGHYYHVRGDFEAAVRHYLRAIAIDPRSAQAHYNLGLAFADSKIYAEALREWERVIELAPQSELGRTAAENVRLIKTYLNPGNSEGGR